MSKTELAAIETVNRAINNAAKNSVYVGALTLRKSKNTWTFCGCKIIVDILTANMDAIMTQIENEISETDEEKLREVIPLGDPKYQTPVVLPPMPFPLESMPVVATRSYVSHALAILMDVHDARTMYAQARPSWWPVHIPFAKPGAVPEVIASKHGPKGSSVWHRCLKFIVYLVQKFCNQDFRKNIDKKGWQSFTNKLPGRTHLPDSIIVDGDYPPPPNGIEISSKELWGKDVDLAPLAESISAASGEDSREGTCISPILPTAPEQDALLQARASSIAISHEKVDTTEDQAMTPSSVGHAQNTDVVMNKPAESSPCGPIPVANRSNLMSAREVVPWLND